MVLWALLGAAILAPCYWLLVPERSGWQTGGDRCTLTSGGYFPA